MGWLRPRPEREFPRDAVLGPVITLQRRTLAQRLAEGQLSAGEALRVALEAAQAVRALHEEGRVHGALSPHAIELTPSGLALASPPMQPGLPTPYAAPETLKGHSADLRSDIFSFGAIVYEMIAGRWPFEGDTPELLALALQNAPIPQTGQAAVDSLLARCLAKDPAARFQSMRKVQVELRLASVAAGRNEGPARREQFEAVVRSEIVAAIESRVEGRLQSQQTAAAQLNQALTASGERLNRLERRLESAENHSGQFAANAAAQLHALEQTVRAQALALESARTALAQTDDLVERVVEALDFLQSTVLERSEFVHGAMALQQGRVVRPVSG